ncbi:MAG: cytochrome c [Alphaproteobacteria bacterium]|uniref:Cytochrome c n=1 Tax=Candidatus Nitrobium versatile TaxID=2884831 RepID=A0A953J3I6_9BACT|nr:cytochrome c [Candidatus Nitrobium versatile]
MSNKAARNLFIYGSIFFFVIFLALTYDTMSQLDQRAPEITEEVNAGKMAWHKYDCIGCHTIFGNGSYFAPDMTKIAEKKPKGYLKQFLLDPKAVNPNASMPKLGLNATEADNMIVFLDWISKVDTNGWPPKPILAAATGAGGQELTPGQKVYRAQNCAACHTLNGIGGTTGPALDKVGSRRDRAWILGHFKDPKAFVPNSAMPPYGHLSEKDLNDLTDYMVSLK